MADADILAVVTTGLCDALCHVTIATIVEGSDAPTTEVHLSPESARELATRLMLLADTSEAAMVREAGRIN